MWSPPLRLCDHNVTRISLAKELINDTGKGKGKVAVNNYNTTHETIW
jgi:hypothetical protein